MSEMIKTISMLVISGLISGGILVAIINIWANKRLEKQKKLFQIEIEDYKVTLIQTQKEFEAKLDKSYLVYQKKFEAIQNTLDFIDTFISWLNLSFVKELEYDIWGEKIIVFILNFIFEAVIDSIENNTEINEYKIKYTGTDIMPLNSIYLGYLSKDDIPATCDFNEEYKKYSKTKTLSEIVNEIF